MISVIRSGMDAAIQKLDVTSNNIANARTTGFKRREATFEDMYSTAISTPTGDRIGIGVRTPEIRMIQTQGNLQMTDDVLDLAVLVCFLLLPIHHLRELILRLQFEPSS